MVRRFRYRFAISLHNTAHRRWYEACRDPFAPTLAARFWSKVCVFALWVSPWRWPPPAGEQKEE